MRLILMLAFFLGAFLGSADAHASERHRFLVLRDAAGKEVIATPQKVAAEIQASLARDPSGRSVINEVSCSRYRACAKPEDYIPMIAKSDPTANINDVAQLPGYLRSLEARTAPSTGQYWMACMKGDADRDDMPVWDCMTRSFHPGETVYVNPVTGRMVFARDCTNPVGKEQHEQDCVEINVALKQGDELHVGYLGPDAFPSGKCKLSVQKTGEKERSGYQMDECPRVTCDFSGPAADLGGLKVWDYPRISWQAARTGNNVIRVPRELLTVRGVLVLCVIKPDGRQSNGKVIGGGKLLKGTAYIDDKSVVTYGSMVGSVPWRGKPHTWIFTDGSTE